MSKGGYREGAGRKPVANTLKTGSFRLSSNDIKLIDKKGIGRSSSERLRYIINNFISEKITPTKFQDYYTTIISSDFDSLQSIYYDINKKWNNMEKNIFLLSTDLNYYIKEIFENECIQNLEKSPMYSPLKKRGWLVQNIIIDLNNNSIENFSIFLLSKQNQNAVISSKNNDHIIYKKSENNIDSTEKYLISSFYDNIKTDFDDIFSFPDFNSFTLSKKYSNNDIYMNIEYKNIIIAEFNYYANKNQTELSYLKGIIKKD